MLLVTGGAGFIGSSIVEALVARGEPVRVLDNFSTGRLENLSTVRDAVAILAGDLRDQQAVRAAVAGVEVIFHQAALPSVPRSIVDPHTTMEVNVTGTLNLLLAARDAGCRRVVFASSSSVYGDSPSLPTAETRAPAPMSPYAVSKLTGEHLCHVFMRTYGLETVVLRYFNVFGPRQDAGSGYAAVIPTFLNAIRGGRTPVIYGDGEQSRDFTYVDNVVAANLLAASTGDAAGRVFNIAAGQSITINSMLRQMTRMLGVESVPEHAPPRPGDVRASLADLSAAQQSLGYVVRVRFADGMRRTIDACSRYPPYPTPI
jgi:UDP-glucose 4-epimerase